MKALTSAPHGLLQSTACGLESVGHWSRVSFVLVGPLDEVTASHAACGEILGRTPHFLGVWLKR